MTDREIIQQALDALLHMCNTTKAQNDYNAKIVDKALVALEAALAQPEQDHGFDRTASHMAGEYVDTVEQKPVAWMFEDDEDNGHKTFQSNPPTPTQVAYLAEWKRPAWTPLYTAPPRKEWVGLTDEERYLNDGRTEEEIEYARAIEAKLKEKNT